MQCICKVHELPGSRMQSAHVVFGGLMMKVFVVYCHSGSSSYTHDVCDSFIKGLKEAGHEIV